MKSLTETLLWLSREGEIEMPTEMRNFGILVQNSQNELSYLLTGKSVVINVEIDERGVNIALV